MKFINLEKHNGNGILVNTDQIKRVTVDRGITRVVLSHCLDTILVNNAPEHILTRIQAGTEIKNSHVLLTMYPTNEPYLVKTADLTIIERVGEYSIMFMNEYIPSRSYQSQAVFEDLGIIHTRMFRYYE